MRSSRHLVARHRRMVVSSMFNDSAPSGRALGDQSLNVRGLQREPPKLEQGAGYKRRLWVSTDGQPVMEFFTVTGMDTACPSRRRGQMLAGTWAPSFLDAGISATSDIARFWDLESKTYRAAQAAFYAVNSAPAQYASSAAGKSANADADAALRMRSPFNPNEVIAAAFKAAGLPPSHTPGAGSAKVDPAAVIAAASRAAGLSRP